MLPPASSLDEYTDVIYLILDHVLRWKEEHSECLLFATSLQESDNTIMELNVNIMNFLDLVLLTASASIKGAHWDFVLCSLVSWIQVGDLHSIFKLYT